VLVTTSALGQGVPHEGLVRRTPWEATMKELKCRDVGFDCDAVVHGETVDDVMAQAGPHAKDAHGVDVTPEMAGQIKTLVHDA
jgi:predicted small metal-binding protein